MKLNKKTLEEIEEARERINNKEFYSEEEAKELLGDHKIKKCSHL